ncbi:MAG: ATP-binding protein [Bacteroidetes bacterium]|nr:ATP-binding protein [Bacteroidota bacterium]
MLIPRPKYTEAILKAWDSLPLVVLAGARQVGKTSIMQMQHTEGERVFLNGQNPDVSAVFQRFSDLEDYLKIQLKGKIEGFLFIDEYQFIGGVATMLKLLTDQYDQLKILCSGSSSLDVLQKVDESLAGRVRIIEVYSLSFEEYLLFTDPELHKKFNRYRAETPDIVVDKTISTEVWNFLRYGGMPRIVLQQDPKEKVLLLDDIYRTYLLRDVRSYVRFEDTIGFNKLLRLLSHQIGNLLNINELSRSSGLSYPNCEEYLSLLEQMHIIKRIEPFASNKRKALSKMKKIYFADLGLRNAIAAHFPSDETDQISGHLFENFVFLELKKTFPSNTIIQFYRTYDETEIDFILNDYLKLISVEVKFKDLGKPLALAALKRFNLEHNVNQSFVVNKSFNGVHEGLWYLPGYFTGKIVGA